MVFSYVLYMLKFLTSKYCYNENHFVYVHTGADIGNIAHYYLNFYRLRICMFLLSLLYSINYHAFIKDYTLRKVFDVFQHYLKKYLSNSRYGFG